LAPVTQCEMEIPIAIDNAVVCGSTKDVQFCGGDIEVFACAKCRRDFDLTVEDQDQGGDRQAALSLSTV